jgi:hypothetical protein
MMLDKKPLAAFPVRPVETRVQRAVEVENAQNGAGLDQRHDQLGA